MILHALDGYFDNSHLGIRYFKVDYCFTIMSYDGLVYYLIST